MARLERRVRITFEKGRLVGERVTEDDLERNQRARRVLGDLRIIETDGSVRLDFLRRKDVEAFDHEPFRSGRALIDTAEAGAHADRFEFAAERRKVIRELRRRGREKRFGFGAAEKTL